MSNVSSPDKSAPQADRVPWSSGLGLFVAAVVFYGAAFLSGMFVSLYPALRHWTHAQAVAWLNDSTTAQFSYIALTEVLSIGAIYLFLRHFKRGLGSLGLKKPRWRDPVYALAVLPAYFIVYAVSIHVAIKLFPGLDINQKQQIGFDNVRETVQLVQTFVALVILVPLAEEIMVRGLLYSSLKKAMPLAGAVLTTSLIFACAHLPEGGPAGPLYIGAIDTFILSLFLIYLREKTGSLWASITLHALKNGLAFFVLFVAPLVH